VLSDSTPNPANPSECTHPLSGKPGFRWNVRGPIPKQHALDCCLRSPFSVLPSLRLFPLHYLPLPSSRSHTVNESPGSPQHQPHWFSTCKLQGHALTTSATCSPLRPAAAIIRSLSHFIPYALHCTSPVTFVKPYLGSLGESKDPQPFLSPVGVVAMNIPHHPEIVTHLMDFSTIERKPNFSNPTKPDPNSENPRYQTADQFIADVRLVFTNCVKFNGPEHAISQMGGRVEELFDKSIKNLPPPEEAKPPPVEKAPAPAPAPPAPAPAPPAPAPAPPAPTPAVTTPAKQRAPHRPSTSTPVIRRNNPISAGGSRPKREIHPPPSKDLPYADVPKKSRKARPRRIT